MPIQSTKDTALQGAEPKQSLLESRDKSYYVKFELETSFKNFTIILRLRWRIFDVFHNHQQKFIINPGFEFISFQTSISA